MNLINYSAAKNTVTIISLLAFSNVIFGAENSYPVGAGALEVFGAEALPLTPLWVKVWLGFLFATFAGGAYFSWKHSLARWAIGGFLVSMTTGHFIYSTLNLPLLGGGIAIMHLVCWSPALLLLYLKRPYFDSKEPMGFRIWAGCMTGVITFSFIFDIRDAMIYINHINGLV